MMDRTAKIHEPFGALVWAFTQQWGNRILIFILFLVLARVLTPSDLGLASTASLLLVLLGHLAEFGYGQAIIQKPMLRQIDVALPFATSMILSVVMAFGLVIFRSNLERILKAPDLAAVLPYAALSLPFATLSAFQEAFGRRAMDYRMLAIRMLTATALSVCVGVAAALMGLGPLSLVLQALVLSMISAVWFWARPRWIPTARGSLESWRAMSGFSVHVVGSRLMEFATTRIVDVLVLTSHGLAALGLYAVGSRVYLTAMQVLTSAVTDVSLGAASRMVDDRPRLVATYLNSAAICSLVCSPICLGVAVLSPEIAVIVFGTQWADSAAVMEPLMLLGSIQSVQFVNGAYFSALGKPGYVFGLNLIKAGILVPALTFIPTVNVAAMVWLFVGCQLLITPLTFTLLAHVLDTRWRDIVYACRSVLLSLVAAGATILIRRHVDMTATSAWARLLSFGSAFGIIYLSLAWLLARKEVDIVLHLALSHRRRAPAGAH